MGGKGDTMSIRVDANVPYGNVCDASVTDWDGGTEVAFTAHPHGGPECLWFCFRLSGDATGAVRLVLKHMRTMLGGSVPEAVRPVVRPANGDWSRLGPGRGEEHPDGQLDVTWIVEPFQGYLDVAFCYPYGREEVDALVRETQPYWRADAIGVSQGGRPIIRLSNRYGAKETQRPGLFVVARQHSGETPGSWVLDGFLRKLAALGEGAPLVWAVPLANIDGVESGDYGKDNFPYDLNRAWGTPPMRHENLVLKADLAQWKARCRPALVLDFHAPGGCETNGIYAYLPRPSGDHDQHDAEATRWADVLKGSLGPEYAAEPFGRVPDYPSRWGTPALTECAAREHHVCALAIETPYACIGDHVLTRDDYRSAGARIAAGIVSDL